MLRVCFLRFARGEVVWNAGDADGFGVADAEGGVGTSSSSRSPRAGGNSNKWSFQEGKNEMCPKFWEGEKK